ncbi:hypothetical protein MSG28_016174 [Choristoneura fumiferana]|uniref:Uncharacterized protein n=1 Tax=Choristoneura fumiferana TaxID=7141 RepID=A0ACC0K6B5_CHOFU|nr:hypothetical protein MSG28_016174 [Choristoneura fumiferana]
MLIQPSPDYISIGRNGSSNESLDKNGGLRTNPTGPQFHFSNVSCQETRRHTPSNIQSKKLKPIRIRRQVQTNKSTNNSELYSGFRLDGQNRSVKRLLPPSDSPGPSMLFKANLQRNIVANDLFTFRPLISSQSLCHAQQLGSSVIKRQKRQSNCLPGRLSDSVPGQRRIGIPYKPGIKYTDFSRVAHKHRKIYSNAAKNPSIFGHNVESPYELKVVTVRQMPGPPKEIRISNNKKDSKFETNGKSSRVPEFCKFLRYKRTPKSPVFTTFLPTSSQNRSQKPIPNTPRSSKGAPVVVAKSYTGICHSPISGVTSSDHRRVRSRLGRPTEQSGDTGILVATGKVTTFECKGNACDLQSLSNANRLFSHDSISTVRQPNCVSISEESGGNKISTTFRSDSKTLQNFNNTGHCTIIASPTRSVQCRSRSSITPKEDAGVAPTSPIYPDVFQKIRNSGDRFIRLSSSSRCPTLCKPECKRPQRRVSRCSESNMELSPGMGVSTPLLNTTGSKPHESRRGSLLSSSAQVGESFLAPGCQTTGNSSPLYYSKFERSSDRHSHRASPIQSCEHVDGDLEMWGWDSALKNWTPEQKKFLKSSWRKSTMKTYKPAWRRWCQWSQDNNVNCSNPNSTDLARFLTDIFQKHDFSYSTMALHKSVVSTLCDPNKSRQLSSHPLVRQVMKSVAIRKPKNEKAPIWDIDTLSNWLSKATMNNLNSLYECSRRTACLLLLCSGRRVHDLTLLTIGEDNCEIKDNSVIFWPEYGSKTDGPDYRQQGWCFISNQESQALDPVYWVKQLIELSNQRREEKLIKNLFISVCGEPKPASKTTIANWIKSLLQEAGITASPGSIRSAVASKKWLPNDMVNYMEYYIMGKVSQVRLKAGCTPKKFVCQGDGRKRTGSTKRTNKKAKKQKTIAECPDESKQEVRTDIIKVEVEVEVEEISCEQTADVTNGTAVEQNTRDKAVQTELELRPTTDLNVEKKIENNPQLHIGLHFKYVKILDDIVTIACAFINLQCELYDSYLSKVVTLSLNNASTDD